MVTRRMYVTGGIGSLPGLEGFGNDYELDPEHAYAETCASLASLFWNWEMAQLTKEAKYSDLFEWQLYNAAAVGMGLDGTTYLFNNPLTCRGGVTRRQWYSVPCCPSNLSRTWANLGKYIISSGVQSPQTLPPKSETSDSAPQKNIWIHQYISSETTVDVGIPVNIKIESELPWSGKVLIYIDPSEKKKFKLYLRTPSWSPKSIVNMYEPVKKQMMKNNNEEYFAHTVSMTGLYDSFRFQLKLTNLGYDPRASWFTNVNWTWSPGDVLEFNFDMSIQLHRTHSKVKGHQGKVAITRGPLVYCLESVDNSNIDIFKDAIDTSSLEPVFDSSLLNGIVKIIGQTKTGKPITFIPYHLWGNRGESTMTVWVNE
jgi:DUF1680 family protein